MSEFGIPAEDAGLIERGRELSRIRDELEGTCPTWVGSTFLPEKLNDLLDQLKTKCATRETPVFIIADRSIDEDGWLSIALFGNGPTSERNARMVLEVVHQLPAMTGALREMSDALSRAHFQLAAVGAARDAYWQMLTDAGAPRNHALEEIQRLELESLRAVREELIRQRDAAIKERDEARAEGFSHEKLRSLVLERDQLAAACAELKRRLGE